MKIAHRKAQTEASRAFQASYFLVGFNDEYVSPRLLLCQGCLGRYPSPPPKKKLRRSRSRTSCLHPHTVHSTQRVSASIPINRQVNSWRRKEKSLSFSGYSPLWGQTACFMLLSFRERSKLKGDFCPLVDETLSKS